MENKNKGWVCLWRKMQEKGWYKNSKYVHLWVNLLLKANHEPKEFLWNGKTVIIKSGQFITGRKTLSEETGISESTIEKILKLFEKERQIEQQKTNKFRLITIINYEQYQKKEQQTTQQAIQQKDTNNNVNNVNNIAETSSAEFDSKSYIEEMAISKQRHIKLIGWYFKAVKMRFPSLKAIQREIKRHLKDAQSLTEYPDPQINKTVIYVKSKFPEEWKLSTVLKYINKI